MTERGLYEFLRAMHEAAMDVADAALMQASRRAAAAADDFAVPYIEDKLRDALGGIGVASGLLEAWERDVTAARKATRPVRAGKGRR